MTPTQLRAAIEQLEREGWKVVPKEPTHEMCVADWNVSLNAAHTDTGVSECAYAAMLSAAPEYSRGDPVLDLSFVHCKLSGGE